MAISQYSNPVWTGPKSGQRYAEYETANKYGLKYTPGQAAGTAEKQYQESLLPKKFYVGKPTFPQEAATFTQDVQGTPTYNIENDPYYQNALAAGQSEFNLARANALADLQNQQTGAESNLRSLNQSATESRRRLAGNYAARGMAGGAAGALTLAEAEANARQIASQTSIKDQIAALNQNYLANYGAEKTDWTGTLLGQKYKTAAVQQALQARLGQMGL